jgi:hypothetical protein
MVRAAGIVYSRGYRRRKREGGLPAPAPKPWNFFLFSTLLGAILLLMSVGYPPVFSFFEPHRFYQRFLLLLPPRNI